MTDDFKIFMTPEEKELEFISFCIEMYSKKHNKSGVETELLFEKNKILDFIQKSYDMLHTQGENYIVSTIEKRLEIK